jgi:hypothetical protein
MPKYLSIGYTKNPVCFNIADIDIMELFKMAFYIQDIL